MLGSEESWSVVALAIRSLAAALGVTFLFVGVCGFISGCVDRYDTLAFAGPGSDGLLFGVFQVSMLHNIVHLLFGLVGLTCFSRALAASRYLLLGGAVYLALWIYGLVLLAVDGGAPANFLPLNTADNWLHFSFGVSMVMLGLVAYPLARRASAVVATEQVEPVRD